MHSSLRLPSQVGLPHTLKRAAEQDDRPGAPKRRKLEAAESATIAPLDPPKFFSQQRWLQQIQSVEPSCLSSSRQFSFPKLFVAYPALSTPTRWYLPAIQLHLLSIDTTDQLTCSQASENHKSSISTDAETSQGGAVKKKGATPTVENPFNGTPPFDQPQSKAKWLPPILPLVPQPGLPLSPEFLPAYFPQVQKSQRKNPSVHGRKNETDFPYLLQRPSSENTQGCESQRISSRNATITNTQGVPSQTQKANPTMPDATQFRCKKKSHPIVPKFFLQEIVLGSGGCVRHKKVDVTNALEMADTRIPPKMSIRLEISHQGS